MILYYYINLFHTIITSSGLVAINVISGEIVYRRIFRSLKNDRQRIRYWPGTL